MLFSVRVEVLLIELTTVFIKTIISMLNALFAHFTGDKMAATHAVKPHHTTGHA